MRLAGILLEYEQRQPLDDTPQAASTLASIESQARYPTLTYAEQNSFCHSGIKGIVQQGEFQELGERIKEDKRSLEAIFRERPDERNEMRSRINSWRRNGFSNFGLVKHGRATVVVPSMRQGEF